MIEYPVIVEQKNGHWRAVIPALADLSVEGGSCDEAVSKAQAAAEAYLSKVVVRTIRVNAPAVEARRFSTAEDWINAAGKYGIADPDDELYQQYLAELEAEKQRQCEEAAKEADLAEKE